MIVCWLASSRFIWTSIAFRETSTDEGALEGSFTMWWLWLAEDNWCSETAGVAVISYLGVDVSSSKVCAVTGAAGIYWEAVVVARCGIGVLRSATFDSKTTTSLPVSVTRVSFLSGYVLSGVVSALWLNDSSWLKVISGKLVGWIAGCSVLLYAASEGSTIVLISEGGLTSSMITYCWSTSKEAYELLVPPAKAPTPVALSFCFCIQASDLIMFCAALSNALLTSEGVDSLEGCTGAFFQVFFPFLLISGSSSLSEASASACFYCSSWGAYSLITIPLSMALESLCVDFASAAAFISLAAMADISSSALEEEEEVSLTSLNNLLLLTLLSSEIGERLLCYLFFFLSFLEGLDLTF